MLLFCMVFFCTNICMGADILFFGPLYKKLTELIQVCEQHPPLENGDDNTCDKLLLTMLVHSFYDNASISQVLPGNAEKVIETINRVAQAPHISPAQRSNFYRALLLAWLPPKAPGWKWEKPEKVLRSFALDYKQNVHINPSLILPTLVIAHPNFNFYNIARPKALLYRAVQYLNLVTRKKWSLLQSWRLQDLMPVDKLSWAELQKSMWETSQSWNDHKMLVVIDYLRYYSSRIQKDLDLLKPVTGEYAKRFNPNEVRADFTQDTDFDKAMRLQADLYELRAEWERAMARKTSQNTKKNREEVERITREIAAPKKEFESLRAKIRRETPFVVQSIKFVITSAHSKQKG